MTLEPNKIYCGDSFNFCEKIKDQSIDLIICDGPYGVTQNNWDRIPSIQEFNLDLIKRFSKKLKEGGGFIPVWEAGLSGFYRLPALP